MLQVNPGNSSAEVSTEGLGHCACCHEYGQLSRHWDRSDLKICGVCIPLLFRLEGHGALSQTVIAFHNALQAGGL
jgi:hypothetical protein